MQDLHFFSAIILAGTICFAQRIQITVVNDFTTW